MLFMMWWSSSKKMYSCYADHFWTNLKSYITFLLNDQFFSRQFVGRSNLDLSIKMLYLLCLLCMWNTIRSYLMLRQLKVWWYRITENRIPKFRKKIDLKLNHRTKLVRFCFGFSIFKKLMSTPGHSSCITVQQYPMR